MKLLLDTHVIIWILKEPEKIPSRLHACMQDPGTKLFYSAISVWEIFQKCQTGKLVFLEPVSVILMKAAAMYGLEELSFDAAACALLPRLPDIHRDPFDRMLICQAIQHGLTMATTDRYIKQYPLSVVS